MKWRKPPYQQFIFDSYELSPKKHAIFLRYWLDRAICFEEVLRLPQDMALPDNPSPLLDRALFYLHLIGGISYFKTYLPPEIVVKSGVLDKKEALFWNKLYTYGLGEFFYKNKIDFRGVVEFPYTQKEPQKRFLIRSGRQGDLPIRNDSVSNEIVSLPTGRQASEFFHSEILRFAQDDRKAQDDSRARHEIASVAGGDLAMTMLPLGGGKDSLVSAELLAQDGRDFDLFTIGDHPLFERIAKKLGKRRIVLSRHLSPELLKLNACGALNGHVPISAYIAFASVVVAILKGYTSIVLSNEQSANEGNADFLGMTVNHQYSKSLAFERDFSRYIHAHLTPDIHYFSLLRPFSELQITELFARYPQYFSYFSSCNKNFTIGGRLEKRLFCGQCAKCAFVFALLAAFIEKKSLINIFHNNLFADEKLLPLYKELLGISGVKPFDCVGTPNEVVSAFSLAREQGEFADDFMMQFFEKKVLPKISDISTIKKRAFPLYSPHNVPKSFQNILRSAYEILETSK